MLHSNFGRAASLALLLVAPSAARKPHFSPSVGESARYACADGRSIEVLYSGGDAAVLTIGGATVQLARAAAEDGERYVGGGWQWWGRAPRAGALSPAAGGAETSCRAG